MYEGVQAGCMSLAEGDKREETDQNQDCPPDNHNSPGTEWLISNGSLLFLSGHVMLQTDLSLVSQGPLNAGPGSLVVFANGRVRMMITAGWALMSGDKASLLMCLLLRGGLRLYEELDKGC